MGTACTIVRSEAKPSLQAKADPPHFIKLHFFKDRIRDSIP